MYVIRTSRLRFAVLYSIIVLPPTPTKGSLFHGLPFMPEAVNAIREGCTPKYSHTNVENCLTPI